MATLSFLMGFVCLAPFRKKGGCQIHSAVTYMMAGLLVLNVRLFLDRLINRFLLK